MAHEEVRAMLYYLTEHAARSLRAEGLLARRVTVKVRYGDFTTVTAARTLGGPADDDQTLYEAASERLSSLLVRRTRVRLVGVALSRLTAERSRQTDLFAETKLRRRRMFYRALDRLREKHGFDIAVVGPTRDMIARDGSAP